MPTIGISSQETAAAESSEAVAQENSELVTEIKRLNTSILTMRSMVNELITSHNDLKDQVASLQQQQLNAQNAAARSLQQLLPVAASTPTVNTTAAAASVASNGAPSVLAALQQREMEHAKKLVRKERLTEFGADGTKTIHANEYKEIFSSLTCPNEFQTTDEEVDDIITRYKLSDNWPVRRKTYIMFSTNVDLLKIRFHHSEKYNHVPIRIQSAKGSKGENRARCKLCSSYNDKATKGVGRNTSWMCSTCEVPLCVKCLVGETSDIENTHHAKWHTARDLVNENALCCAEVVGSRKRGRASMQEGDQAFADEVDRVTKVD